MSAAWTQEHASKIYNLANEIAQEAVRMLDGNFENALPQEGAEPIEPVVSTANRDSYYLMLKAENLYKIHRQREAIFGEKDLFSDPCWDILLDLFVAHCKGQDISVSSACLAAQVPATTALRWMTVMEKLGLIERQKDKVDSRRRFVRLTEKSIAHISTILEGAA